MADQPIDARVQQAARVQGQQHNPLRNIHDRLFYNLFCRISLFYARAVPRYLQRTLEFLLLFQALTALGMLTCIHLTFIHEPVDCLHHVLDVWPKNGILRVEIIKNASDNYTLLDSYKKHVESVSWSEIDLTDVEENSEAQNDILEALNVSGRADSDKEKNNKSVSQILHFYLQPYILHLKTLPQMFMRRETYIVEYSLEYGLLRMSPKTRNHLNVTVMLVVLDPTKDKCFGGWFSQTMLEEFLGYEDVLFSSLQQLSERQNYSGFFRNVVSGDNYRAVELSESRISYLAAAFLMIFFTLSVSMLLRYAHQQIFLFIVDLLQVFDRNALITFPLSPLLTAILALIGVEAMMSELFMEASTAFYVILIVWLADQYDVICCHTNISRRHWLRFFYMYHFFFYAYHYRFNGHFSSITLATSWLFIQHSMIYFFHHYELPAIIHHTRVQRLLLQAQQSVAFQTPRRGGSHSDNQSLTASVQPHSNFSAVVAFMPDNLSNQAGTSEDAANGTVVRADRSAERQQRDNWSPFSLPSFRLSNSLILAQVFIWRQQDSRPASAETPSVQSEDSALPGSSDTDNRSSADISETNVQSTASEAGSSQSSPSVSSAMQGDKDAASFDVLSLPQKSEIQLDEAHDPLNNDVTDLLEVGNAGGGGSRSDVPTAISDDTEGDIYQERTDVVNRHITGPCKPLEGESSEGLHGPVVTGCVNPICAETNLAIASNCNSLPNTQDSGSCANDSHIADATTCNLDRDCATTTDDRHRTWTGDSETTDHSVSGV